MIYLKEPLSSLAEDVQTIESDSKWSSREVLATDFIFKEGIYTVYTVIF